jgi:hypothetical protein
MNTAKIVIREVQSYSGFQVRQLFAEPIRKARKAAHRRSHGQVLSFDKRCADVLRIGPTVDDFGHNLRDSWWGQIFRQKLNDGEPWPTQSSDQSQEQQHSV